MSKKHSTEHHKGANTQRWGYVKKHGIEIESLKFGNCKVPGCKRQHCPKPEIHDDDYPADTMCIQWHANRMPGFDGNDPNQHPDKGKGCRCKKDELRSRWNSQPRSQGKGAAACSASESQGDSDSGYSSDWADWSDESGQSWSDWSESDSSFKSSDDGSYASVTESEEFETDATGTTKAQEGSWTTEGTGSDQDF